MQDYFYSIEPFWPKAPENSISYTENDINMVTCDWSGMDSFFCIPGNAQMGLAVDAFTGESFCYGILKEAGNVKTFGLQHGYLLRFPAGTFCNLYPESLAKIDPIGLPASEVLPEDLLNEIRSCLDQENPGVAMVRTVIRYMETHGGRNRDNELINTVVREIWRSKGTISIKDLEVKTGYSGRYIRDILQHRVGISTKQMCQQIRFQNSLKVFEEYLHKESDDKLNLAIISSLLGYTDQAHFNREFKAFSGMSPKEYLKRVQEIYHSNQIS